MDYLIISKEKARQIKVYIPDKIFERYEEDVNQYCVDMCYDGLSVGTIIFKVEKKYGRILHIYVNKDYRHRGFAFEGINFIRKKLSYMGISNILTSYCGSNEIGDIYEKLLLKSGFSKEIDEAKGIIFNLGDAFLHKELLGSIPNKKNNSVFIMKEINNIMLTEFNNELVKNNVYENIYPKDYDENLSCFYINSATNKIIGCILMTKLTEGLEINFLYNGKSSSPIALLELMWYAFENVKKQYSLDTTIYTACLNTGSLRLVEKFVDNVTKISSNEYIIQV